MRKGTAPLEGIKVLDVSRVLAGPWATMSLGDLGAEIWKIENPDGGDESRTWKPPAYHGTATYYLSINRNKQSIAIDLKTPRGREIIQELARRCDIFVENYLPSTLKRYGLDYESLAGLNPRIIYCSITGYGCTGAYAERAGYDFVIQAESGLMSITGEPDGRPQKFGLAITDLIGGMNATQAILAALYARERTGQGQFLDIALLDGAVAVLSSVASALLNAGTPAVRHGNMHPSIVPYQTFEAADGSFVLACANNRQFKDLCSRVIEKPELARDPRFATNPDRVQRRAVLIPLLSEAFAAMTVRTILSRCLAANVPAGAIRSVDQVLAADEVRARGLVVSMFDRANREIRSTGSPFHFSLTPVRAPSAPPDLGQDTAAVLRSVLGYSEATIRELQEARVIYQAPPP